MNDKVKNTLDDTMSSLIDIDPEIKHESDPRGYEFHYYVSVQLQDIDIKTKTKDRKQHVIHTIDEIIPTKDKVLDLPITNDELQSYKNREFL